jgi:UDP-glucose 4-epimerase
MVLKKVGLTGASGMVGQSLIEVLNKNNVSYIAATRSKIEVITPESSWVNLDLVEWQNMAELDEMFPDVQAFFHIGALVPKTVEDNHAYGSIFDVNVRSCLYLAHWATQKSIPLVFLSSATVYDNPEQENIKELDKKTTGGFGGFYGYSKLLAEETLQYFVKEGLKLCILRPSSIFGYGLPDTKMITKFLLTAALNETIQLEKPIEDKINLIHSYDVANAMLQALLDKSWGIFNIADKTSYSIVDIAKTCVKVVGQGKINILDNQYTKNDVHRFRLNCTLAQKAFSFQLMLSFEDGIQKMWLDIKKNIKVKNV